MENEAFDVVIIGSGLGGMLSGALAISKGAKVLITEKANLIGGRFTSINKDGFMVPSGAFHMAPYGKSGVLNEIISHLGFSDRIMPLHDNAFWANGKIYGQKKSELLKMFGIVDALVLKKILDSFPKIYEETKNSKEKFNYVLEKITKSKKIYNFFNSFCEFSIGCHLNSIPAKDFATIMIKVANGARPGFIKGGCGALISDLKSFIESSNGSKIITRAEVIKLHSENSKIKNAEIKYNEQTLLVEADTFIYNGVPARLNNLNADLLSDFQNVPIAQGAGLHFACTKPPVDKKGIVLTLGAGTIPGFVVESNFDSTLSPENKSLLSTCFDTSNGNLKENIEKAMKDLYLFFGEDFIKNEMKLLRVCNYTKHWPANHAIQGFDLSGFTAFHNLFIVGDGAKAEGFIMAEGVASSVKRILDKL